MKYWWISAIIIIIAALMVLFTYLLRKDRKATMITLFAVSLALLLYKSILFGVQRVDHKYPVEFSHLSYFIMGAVVVVGVKKIRPFAGFCAFVSGLGFLLAGIFAPADIYEGAESTFSWISSIIQHEVLLFGGMLIIFNTDRFNIKEIWISVVGMAIMCIFSVLVYNRILYPDLLAKNHDNMVIIEIISGTILKHVFRGATIPVVGRVFTIIGEVIFFGAVLVGYYFANNKIYDKRIKGNPKIAEDGFEFSALVLVNYIIKKVKEKKSLQASATSSQDTIQGNSVEGIDSTVEESNSNQQN